MQIKPAGDGPSIPTAPQLHSLGNHDSYNGTRSLPTATWVRSPTVRPTTAEQHTLVYEVVLYYRRNRACTIYRTRDDFAALRRGITGLTSSSSSSLESLENDVPHPAVEDRSSVDDLHGLLREAIAKHGGSCAVEYFLRRRLGDCGGR